MALAKHLVPFYFSYMRVRKTKSEKYGNQFRRQIQSQELYVTTHNLMEWKSSHHIASSGIFHFLIYL